MQFEVPQFIDIEDKIFGPLTWRQFLYVGGGVGMAVVLFLIAPWWVFILVGLPIGALALALAFLPINNRPFAYFLEAMFSYLTSERRYFWKRNDSVVYTGHASKESTETVVTSGKKDLSSMARRLEMEALQKDS